MTLKLPQELSQSPFSHIFKQRLKLTRWKEKRHIYCCDMCESAHPSLNLDFYITQSILPGVFLYFFVIFNLPKESSYVNFVCWRKEKKSYLVYGCYGCFHFSLFFSFFSIFEYTSSKHTIKKTYVLFVNNGLEKKTSA